LQRFCQMHGLDRFTPRQIRDRARQLHPLHAITDTRRYSEAIMQQRREFMHLELFLYQ